MGIFFIDTSSNTIRAEKHLPAPPVWWRTHLELSGHFWKESNGIQFMQIHLFLQFTDILLIILVILMLVNFLVSDVNNDFFLPVLLQLIHCLERPSNMHHYITLPHSKTLDT